MIALIVAVVLCALACIAYCVLGWAHARQFGAKRWWPPFLACVFFLLAADLLMHSGEVKAITPEDVIRRSSAEIMEENNRLTEEINNQLRELKWRAKRN